MLILHHGFQLFFFLLLFLIAKTYLSKYDIKLFFIGDFFFPFFGRTTERKADELGLAIFHYGESYSLRYLYREVYFKKANSLWSTTISNKKGIKEYSSQTAKTL